MRARVLPFRRRALPWSAALLVAVLTIALCSPRTAAGEPLPDVVVAGLTLTPASARAGDPVTAIVTLRNQGSGPADSSLVGLYLGTSSWTPLTSAVPLGTLAVDGLAPGASQQVSQSFIVPAVAPGSFSVIAIADGAGTLAESNETNNRRTAGLRVTIADLTVSRLTLAPSHARTGDTVTATAVIYNAGQVPADATTVRLHFETASGVPPTVVGSGLTFMLAAGQSREVSFAFTVPPVPSRRSYYVWAQVDPDGTLLETNEGNNRGGAWLDVTIPDLTISSLSLRPAAARAGDPVTAAVVVRNSGPVPADPSTLRLYFETASGSPPSPPTLLATAAVAALGPGESRELSLPFAVPAVPYGRSYYVWAQADSDDTLLETNEGNNRRGAWLQVTIPDLTITSLSVRPAPARVSDPVTAAVVVRNSGPVPADPSTLRLYFETASGSPPSPPTLLATAAVAALGPGESRELSLPFAVPAVPYGRSYYVWAQADSDDTLLETNEGNNRRGAWLQVAVPDLSVDALSVTPSPTRAGDAITVSLRVRNRGSVPANASRASLYVATTSNAALDGVTPLTTIDVPLLGPGKEAPLVVPVALPVISSGQYYLIAVADSAGAQAEGSETNNRRATGFEVAVPAVTIDALDLSPWVVQAGQVATASVRITNRGRASSRPTTADVFLATSMTAELSEGTYVRTLGIDSLKPGASVSFPVPVGVPVVDPGAYYVIAQVDASTAVGGWTTMLASAASTSSSSSRPRLSLKLRVNQPDLTSEALALSTALVRPGDSITVTFTVRNAGSVSAAASEAGVYLAAQPDASLSQATRVGAQPVAALSAGASVRLTTAVSVPALPPGPHYIVVAADSGGAIAESNETNNRLARGLEVLDTSGELTVWVADTLTRVQRTDPPGTVRSASIKAARNEYEAFQVVVRAPDDAALSNVNAEASDLVGPGVIGRSNITLYRAHYVQVVQSSPGSPYPPGWWPDALIPFKHPETGQPLGGRFPAAPFPVTAGQNQPVWVEVYVPPGTPAGAYTGAVTLTAGGLNATVVPITLTVWNFTLPIRSSVASAFGELWCFWDNFGISATSSAAGDIDWLISKAALQHRVTPSRPGKTLGWYAGDGTALPSNDRLQEWFGTLGATSWEIPSFFADPLGVDRPKAVRYLRTLYDYLAARGWADRAFVYTPTTDEPGSAQDYQEIRDFASMVHEANPNLQVLVTEQPTPENASWGNLVGGADIWVPTMYAYDASAAQARQAAGDRVWAYTTGGYEGLNSPPSWLLDFPILNYRVPLWVNWVNRVEGLLYWQMTYWCEVSDVWTDPRTVRWGGYAFNGEGSLVYPGNAVGYNGPIVSARLKALRDGMEDYEYLKLLANVAGTGVTDSIARTVGTTFFSWSHSAATLQEARETLAERIELQQ